MRGSPLSNITHIMNHKLTCFWNVCALNLAARVLEVESVKYRNNLRPPTTALLEGVLPSDFDVPGVRDVPGVWDVPGVLS